MRVGCCVGAVGGTEPAYSPAMPEWPPVCPRCGEPVAIAGDYSDQFETPEDAEAAGPILHAACASGYARRLDRPRSRVFFYEGPEVGPLSASGE